MNRNEQFALLIRQPVIPVLTIDDPATAVDVARALSDGGLPIIEITLRTEAALEAINEISDKLSGRTIVGAGTIRTPDDAANAIKAGAGFLVAPGVTPTLIEGATRWPVPFLPGVATPSEAMALADCGFTFQKFFPAEPNGGVVALQAWAAPLSGIQFCPTGGVTADNAEAYLALPNVTCVGGSWVAPPSKINARAWTDIEQLATAAAELND